MNFINRNEIANGVYFTNIKDSRFKTMKISVNIVVPLSVETASENALVGGLLVRSCKKYPDFTVLSKKLSSLYGADLTSSLSKHGESQVIKISVSGLDDRYSLDDVSIAKELSELLCSVIFEPNVKDGAFGENLIVTDIDFKNLPIGTRFASGEVVLELTQIGKKCHNDCIIKQTMGDCIMPREGVFCRVLHGGKLVPGDELLVIGEDK